MTVGTQTHGEWPKGTWPYKYTEQVTQRDMSSHSPQKIWHIRPFQSDHIKRAYTHTHCTLTLRSLKIPCDTQQHSCPWYQKVNWERWVQLIATKEFSKWSHLDTWTWPWIIFDFHSFCLDNGGIVAIMLNACKERTIGKCWLVDFWSANHTLSGKLC